MLDLTKYRLILGSKSSRRAELLNLLDWDFEQVNIDADEHYDSSLALNQVAEHLAKVKSDAYGDLKEDEILITADTVVIIGNQILGKPQSEREAESMLQLLSGSEHEVVSGVCLRSANNQMEFSSTSTVCFAQLTAEEIGYYIEKYGPFDKAGAYGIQEWIGAIGVESLTGSYYNVMGLPVHALYEHMKAFLKDE